MKLRFEELRECFTCIELIPETPEETAQLLRFTTNSKREVADIDFRFSSNEPYCGIFFRKINPKKQNNSISNKTK